MTTTHLPSSSVDRRTRRKLKTQRAIQLAALRLAAQHGIEGVTVQVISDAADIAPRTFFTHFSSKEEALALDRLWTATRLKDTIRSRPADESPLQTLRALVKDMAGEITSDLEAMNFWRELRRKHPDLTHRLLGTDKTRVDGIAQGIAERSGLDPQQDAFPAVIAAAAWIAGQIAVDRWLQYTSSGGGQSVDRYVDDVFDILEGGFTGSPREPDHSGS